MIIGDYRNTTRIEADNTNKGIDVFDLSTGDVRGRIIRFALYDGNSPVNPTGLTCQFVINQQGGLYETMTPVQDAETATWEIAPSTHGLEPGICDAAFRVTASDESVTETIPFKIRIVQGILEEGESGTEMQSVLSAFERRVNNVLSIAESVARNVNIIFSDEILTVTDKYGASVTSDAYKNAVDHAEELVTQLQNVDVETATKLANEAAERAETAANAIEDLGKLGLSVVNGQVCQTYIKET